ncbi:MAG: hypothetical protein IKO53_08280 [Lachnospiraceae bacterium]|nr:hypothetical protein [Lachnospiraceae bacterium]
MKKLLISILTISMLIGFIPMNAHAADNASTVSANSATPGTFIGGKEFSNSTMPTITLVGASIDPFFGDYSESYTADYGINPISNWNSMCQGALDAVNAGRAKRGLAPLTYNYEKQNLANTRIYEICNYIWYPSKNYPMGDPHIRPDGTWCYTVGETSEVVSYGYEPLTWSTQTPISIGNPEFIIDADSAYLIGYVFGEGFEASPAHWEVLMRPDITSMNIGIEIEIEGTNDIHFGYSQVNNDWEASISHEGVILVY